MKKILIAVVAAAALSMGSEASASQAPMTEVQSPNQAVIAPQTDALSARRTTRGIFGRLLELERRKNAWLRRTFLNG